MKKILLVVFTLFCFGIANAQTSGRCGTNVTWTLSSDGTLTISGTGGMEYDCYYLSWEEYNIKKVIIENGVTSIGGSAFMGCSSLTSITIPNSVTTIDNYAFAGCRGLISITIPSSVTTIGENAFQGCSGLETIIVDNNNPKYHSSGNCLIKKETNTLILGCKNSIIPSDVTTIGEHAFCSGLTSITIPNSVTTISDYAFSGCSGLTSITIPNSVTSIGSLAFSSCSSLTSITIPNSVTSIGNYAFSDCSSLTSITIPNSVTSIGYFVFSSCSSLTSVTIPGSIKTIDVYFQDCPKLTTITIENGVTTIGYSAFSSCSGLTSITIPSSVTTIGEYAFSSCSGLTSITIPNSVTSIGDFTFEGCCNLTSITIPESVTTIGNYAFYGCSNLSSITIPNSVTSIGRLAFSDCSSLTSITIPNSVTSIGSSAFSSCSSLTSITIPNSVTSIVDYAFSSCSSLTSITIPNSVTSIGNYAFSGCTDITSVAIQGKCSIGEYAFRGCSVLANVFLSDSITGIGSRAFEKCGALKTITIPESITQLRGYTFYNCGSLTSITCLSKNAPSVSESTFQGTPLDTVYVKQERIGSYKAHDFWKTLVVIGGNRINAQSSDISQGNVNVNQNIATQDETIVITAKPQKGYRFIQWSDGNRENPRTIKADSSINITAIFDNKYYVSGQAANGSIDGLGGFELGTTTLLTATPNQGYYFVCWSDGNRENPRAITVNNDIDISAVFDNKYNVVVLAPNGEKHGDGKYEYGTKATIVVAPSAEYQFKQWNDGSHENPRFVTVTSDTILIAEFEVIGKENNSDLSNSINETSATKIVVYPSPTTSIINVAGAENGTAVCIYNINGALVMSEYLNGNQLNVGSLPKGVYFIEIENLGRTKFIKQ